MKNRIIVNLNYIYSVAWIFAHNCLFATTQPRRQSGNIQSAKEGAHRAATQAFCFRCVPRYWIIGKTQYRATKGALLSVPCAYGVAFTRKRILDDYM